MRLHHEGESFGSSLELLSSDQGFDTVDHVLDELLLGSSESSSVGDVEDSVISFSVLSVDSSDLDEELIGNGVELGLVLGKLWELDVNGSSQGSSEVGWA